MPPQDPLSEEQIESAWAQMRARGLSRRQFLALLGAGGGLAAAGAAYQSLAMSSAAPAVASSLPGNPIAGLAGLAAPPAGPGAQAGTATATPANPTPAAAGAATTTASPTPTATPTVDTSSVIYPPPGRLIVEPVPDAFFRAIGGANMQMRFEVMADKTQYATPNSFFFVRCHDTAVIVDQTKWKLSILGDGIDKPYELSYDDLLKLPTTTVTRYVECAGNGRSFYASMLDKPAQGGQWRLGGWGIAEWTGVPFSELLGRAGIKKTALQVMPVGLDKPNVARPMTVAKAMEPDTILAYMMNGDLLPLDHGFPARAIVPGWVGVNNIKWVGRIVVSEQPLFTDYNTKLYVLIGPDYKAEAPSQGVPVNDQVLKSALALPWPATIPPGQQKIAGYAWSPAGKIAKVEVSLDGQKTWQPAQLTGPNIERAGTRFEFTFTATTGMTSITPRATDDKGNTQPPLSAQKWNQQGYVFAAPVPHPITVSSSVSSITASTATPTPVPTATATVTGTVGAAVQTPAAPLASPTAGQAAATNLQPASLLAGMGQKVYVSQCAVCHGANGQGVTAPAVIDANSNLAKYGDGQKLYTFVKTNMPFSSPGSLTPDEYLQVTAFLLLQNDYVKADTPLGMSNLGSIALKK